MANTKTSIDEASQTSQAPAKILPSVAMLDALQLILAGASLSEVLTNLTMIESLVPKMLRKLREQVKRGKLSGQYIRLAKVLAGKGYREAQKILDAHFQRKNNLPVGASGRVILAELPPCP